MTNRNPKLLYRNYKALILGVFLILAICFLPLAQDRLNAQSPQDTPVPNSTPIIPTDWTPYYDLRVPVAYDLEGQPVTPVGALSTLAQENTVMYFYQSFTGVSSGTTYVIFTFSTTGISLTDNYTLTLNWETMGFGNIPGYTSDTTISISIWYQDTQWEEIHTISSPGHFIDHNYGWADYEIPAPYSDYIIGTELKVKFSFSQQLIQTQSWTQWLYMRWLQLEIQENVSVNCINPSAINVISEEFIPSGSVEDLLVEDQTGFLLQRFTPPGGETLNIRFNVSFDLGLYGLDPILGIRLSHFECPTFSGGDWSAIGNIYLVGSTGNTFLCYTRSNLSDPVTPNQLHATSLLLGDWAIDSEITLYYDIQYTVSASVEMIFCLDWVQLEIVRAPTPIVLSEVLNESIYAQQDMWLNITCLDGKAPITEIRLQPWNDLIGNSAGSFLYSHYVDTAGLHPLSLTILDAEGDSFTIPLSSLSVLHRPVSITLYLMEDPQLSEFIVQLLIKDIISNSPLSQYDFTKTILKNGSWFRQQTHQTLLDGAFSIHEHVLDYLDYNYTVIIETQQTQTHAASATFSQILLSECPPYISIDQLVYNDPLKANDQITLFYTVDCQIQLQVLQLYHNGTFFRSLPTTLGSHNYTFQDFGGTWDYFLYANNTRAFQGYSYPFSLDICPLGTHLELESTLDMTEHAIILDIQLFDELNRSCPSVPLEVIIYDFGDIFYSQEVVTGLDGVDLVVHFDRYLDHSFTLSIASQATPLYNGSIASEGTLTYEGYPLYDIIGIGVALGVISIAMVTLKRRLRRE